MGQDRYYQQVSEWLPLHSAFCLVSASIKEWPGMKQSRPEDHTAASYSMAFYTAADSADSRAWAGPILANGE